jgi:hypothetical protein
LYASIPVRNVAKAKNANNNHTVIPHRVLTDFYHSLGLEDLSSSTLVSKNLLRLSSKHRVAADDSLLLTIDALSSLISDQWTNKKKARNKHRKKMRKMAQDAKKRREKKARKKGARRDKKTRKREARRLDYLILFRQTKHFTHQ